MSPMDSKRLSARRKQPGHDTTYRASEQNFVAAARICLKAGRYVVEAKPRDLRSILSGDGHTFGVEPEAAITSIQTRRKLSMLRTNSLRAYPQTAPDYTVRPVLHENRRSGFFLAGMGSWVLLELPEGFNLSNPYGPTRPYDL